mmetsp:Transcript_30674/g.46459  ORF Transcript_30674/g.46459 Transcript_30674/m.46459 type:complete len:84 (+) Transcript_30674:67-318(+)
MNNNLKHNFSHQQIIKYPIITDKATRLLENNQYTFIVDRYSTKSTIKSAIEHLFDVEVIKINTCHLPKKKKKSRQIYWFKTKL